MMVIVVLEDLGVSNRETTVRSLSDLTDSIASAFFLLLRHAETALPDVQRINPASHKSCLFCE